MSDEIKLSTEPATTRAVSEIVNAPQGPHQAITEVLDALAVHFDDARYRLAPVSDGRPLEPMEGEEEALALFEKNRDAEHSARVVANRLGGDPKTVRNNREKLERRLLRKNAA